MFLSVLDRYLRLPMSGLPGLCRSPVTGLASHFNYIIIILIIIDVPRLRESRNTSIEKLSIDFGQLLANTRLPRRFLRQLSNDWIMWSFRWLKRFGDLRSDTRLE